MEGFSGMPAWKEKAIYGEDSYHEIVHDVELKGGGELHRFNNRAGYPYSAIIKDGEEVWSHVRNQEERMVKDWNEWGYKTHEKH